MRAIGVTVGATLVLCVSCGGKDRPAENALSSPPTTASAPATTTPKASTVESAPSRDEWNCSGNLVPPNGWQQETSFRDASSTNARDGAAEDAASRLASRVCGGDVGCDFLRSRVRKWKTGSNGKDVCAMAVIASEDLNEWRHVAASLHKLDEALAAAAKDLVGTLASTKTVAVDRIFDMGYPGGPRADWLKARMERHLQRYVTVGSVPRGWAGDTVPQGLDVILTAEVIERSENQIPIVEANWATVARGGGKRRSDPVIFPILAAPPFTGPSVAPPPAASEGLSMRIESKRAGSLCVGEKTQLWVKSDARLHVRLIDLYGSGEAMITFPNEDQKSGLVNAGDTVPVGGPLGFEAIPVPGSELERFVLIGAATEDGLGRFKSVTGTCRVPAAIARELHRTAGLPAGVKQVWTGYRIVSGEGCPAVSAGKREEMAKALAQVPECRM